MNIMIINILYFVLSTITISITSQTLPPHLLCEEFQFNPDRKISVIIANDIDGGWRNLGGSSRSGQCNNQMNTIYDTLTRIKSTENGASYPSYIVSYVEFDRDGHSIIVGPNDAANQMPVTTAEFNDYLDLITNRCDKIYQERTCRDTDGERTQLKELLIDIRDNESKYGFNTTSAEYSNGNRDRYIILFNSCKLPSSEVHDICNEMEDYIRTRGGFGINVMIMNQGSDGFLGETDADDYILCLAGYDQDRIYTNEQRNRDTFNEYGLERTIIEGICVDEPTSNPTNNPTTDPTSYEPTTQSPTSASPSTQGWLSPTADSGHSLLTVCENLVISQRNISVIIANDIDGGWRNLAGSSRSGQCNNQMDMISMTLDKIKSIESGAPYPSYIVSYVEFDRDGHSIIVGPNDAANQMPITTADITDYHDVIDTRCDAIYQERTCSDIDGERTQLKELLIDIRDNEAKYGFDTTSAEYGGDRDRFIILFNSCKLPSSEVQDICNEMEDYIRTGGDLGSVNSNIGINVMIINQGSDGFLGETDEDNHILCLTEYDPDRIYTNEQRDRFRFDIDGLERIITPEICDEAPTQNPTVKPSASPTSVAPQTTQGWHLPFLCKNLPERQISVIIASDIDGRWRNLASTRSRISQCRRQMDMISDTIEAIKTIESGTGFPSHIVSFVEFDRDGYSMIVGPNDNVNQMPVTRASIIDYHELIDTRCDTIYQDRNCSDIDGERTQLKELLIDIRNNEAKYGFDTASAEYSDGDRDRYIILFNSCKLPSSEVHDICHEMEDYIGTGDDFGINVLIINQGADGFIGETDADDYILCLAEYNQDRIYTNERRDRLRFDIDGLERTIIPAFCDDEPSPNPTIDPTSTQSPTSASPSTQGWLSPWPTADSGHSLLTVCENLVISQRNISVIIANDIDGRWRNLAGSSRSGQCNNQMDMISMTLDTIKSTESGSPYPSYIVSYVEFDRDGHSIIVGPNDAANQMPVTTADITAYHDLIDNRCDTIYQERTCSDIDGERTQLKELLIDIRENEGKYGFDTTSAEYGGGRDRYIILFNSCKLPSSEVHAICNEMEDYIRTSGDFGINVMIMNQGSDGFLGETNADDYILCLAEYDQGRIYTNEQRDRDRFDAEGLHGTIVEGICDTEPTRNPTISPTSAPTSNASASLTSEMSLVSAPIQDWSGSTAVDSSGIMLSICEELLISGRNISVIVASDIDGGWRNLGGSSRISQCNRQMDMISTTIVNLKAIKDTFAYPSSIVSYVEFDRDGHSIIVAHDDYYVNRYPVVQTDINRYRDLIDTRCDVIYQDRTCSDIDGERTQLKELLIDIRDNEAKYGFDTSSSEYSNADRDRYIILFNSCKLPSSEVQDICNEMEDYIRTSGDFGINVMIINQGSDGFLGQTDADDYVLCLADYDQDRIYTNEQRDRERFDEYGLAGTIASGICDTEPTRNPTTDPTNNLTPIFSIASVSPPKQAWSYPNGPFMPRADSFQAVGKWQDDIFLFSGKNPQHGQQVISYNINSGVFTDHGVDILPASGFSNLGSEQYYTQTCNYLFTYPIDSDVLYMFDLSDPTKWHNPFKISGVINMDTGCITSNEEYLFTLGGVDPVHPHGTIQMYDLLNMEWINSDSLPLLKTRRRRHSCVIDSNDMLYAIGGLSTYHDYVASIERAEINGIVSNAWEYIEPLSTGNIGSKAISYKDFVFVVGGYYHSSLYDNDVYLDIVHVIDINTGFVTVSSDKLWYGVGGAAVIISQQTMYAFGGIVGNEGWDTEHWQYYVFSEEDINSEYENSMCYINNEFLISKLLF